MFRAQRDPETMHGGPDHDLGLPGEQLDLAAGAAGAVVQLVEQLRSQWYRVREPDGDVAARWAPRHRMPIQYLADLFVPVEAVDQRDGCGDGGAAAAALSDRHSMDMPGSQPPSRRPRPAPRVRSDHRWRLCVLLGPTITVKLWDAKECIRSHVSRPLHGPATHGRDPRGRTEPLPAHATRAPTSIRARPGAGGCRVDRSHGGQQRRHGRRSGQHLDVLIGQWVQWSTEAAPTSTAIRTPGPDPTDCRAPSIPARIPGKVLVARGVKHVHVRAGAGSEKPDLGAA